MVSRAEGRANIFTMESEEDTLANEMLIQLFSRWKVDPLQIFLKYEIRGAMLLGRKAEKLPE